MTVFLTFSHSSLSRLSCISDNWYTIGTFLCNPKSKRIFYSTRQGVLFGEVLPSELLLVTNMADTPRVFSCGIQSKALANYWGSQFLHQIERLCDQSPNFLPIRSSCICFPKPRRVKLAGASSCGLMFLFRDVPVRTFAFWTDLRFLLFILRHPYMAASLTLVSLHIDTRHDDPYFSVVCGYIRFGILARRDIFNYSWLIYREVKMLTI